MEASATEDTAVLAHSEEGIGVWAHGKQYAGFFEGDIKITGDICYDGTLQSTTEPVLETLTVQKDLKVGGNVIVTGDVRLENADCAEEFDVGDAEGIETGMVMVIDADGKMRRSTEAYDRRVAGVVSGAGSLKPGIVLGKQAGKTGTLPIALIGRVYCRVDAAPGAIEVGDLLTTAHTPGHAMKAADPARAFGAVIGKALHPLKSGRGLIPILVALQ